MLLWCMDEYMYYSLLTMVMLVLFECTVVKQRQHNLELLSLMQRPPTRVYAYRMVKLSGKRAQLCQQDVA